MPSVMTPRSTSTADSASDSTEPTVTEACTAHHIRKNALSRRTALASAAEESSTKRHIACTSAPFERRSSTAVRRSSMPP